MSRHLNQLIELTRSIPVPCWASGGTAAALHGFDGYTLKPPFHVTVQRGHNVHRAGHHVHTTDHLDRIDRAWAQGVPTLSPTRTLLHLAADERPDRLTAALDGALRDGLTSEDFLHRRIAELRRRGRSGIRPLIRALEGHEVTRGGHSWLEREFLRLVSEAGLPRPMMQQVLSKRRDALVRVDCHFPGTRLVVELLGYRWHRSNLDLQRDTERMNALMLDGYSVLQFTYRHITTDHAWVIGQLLLGLGRAAA